MGLDWFVELYDDHDKFMNKIPNEDIEGVDDHYAEGDGYTYLRGKFVSYLFSEFLGSDAGNMCYGEEFERNGTTENYILPSEFYRFKNLLHEVREIVDKKDCKEEMKAICGSYDDIDEFIGDIDFAWNFFDHIIDYNKNGNGWGDEDEIRSTMYIRCSW